LRFAFNGTNSKVYFYNGQHTWAFDGFKVDGSSISITTIPKYIIINNQIDKIKDEIEALKVQIKEEFNITPKDLKSTIAQKEKDLNEKLVEINEKLEELETNNE
jgi:hypothetical protein